VAAVAAASPVKNTVDADVNVPPKQFTAFVSVVLLALGAVYEQAANPTPVTLL